MKIAYLTAGAAGMYCGSCMNDNAVARALIRSGHPEGWLYRHDSMNDLVSVLQRALQNNPGRRAVSEELLHELD
ncbi:MAG: hypothetical protein ACK6DC_22405, partial [Planctomycetota bacterium]